MHDRCAQRVRTSSYAMYKCRCKLPSGEECGAEYATWDGIVRHHNGAHGKHKREAAHPNCVQRPMECRLKEAKNFRPEPSVIPQEGLARLNALMSVGGDDPAESSTLDSWRTRQRMQPRLEELLLQLDGQDRQSFFASVTYPAALDQIETNRCAAQPLFLFGPFP
jgi:hypothetical protein